MKQTKFKLIYKNKSIEIECNADDTVKVYYVPKDYSNDNFYVAVWNPTYDLEPKPACAMYDTLVLAHITFTKDDDGNTTMNGNFTAEGVEYANN